MLPIKRSIISTSTKIKNNLVNEYIKKKKYPCGSPKKFLIFSTNKEKTKKNTSTKEKLLFVNSNNSKYTTKKKYFFKREKQILYYIITKWREYISNKIEKLREVRKKIIYLGSKY